MTQASARAAFSIDGFLVYHRSTDRVSARLHFGANWQMGQPVMCQIGKANSHVMITAISTPEGRARRIISFENGHKFFIDAKDMPEALNIHKWSHRIDKAERQPLLLLVVVSLLVTALFGGLGYLLFPKVADAVSDHIPDSFIQQVSQTTLQQLDLVLLGDSQLSEARKRELTDEYEDLRAMTGLPDDVSLLFRSSALMGPNALALPGGPVILLDELIEIAPSDDGLMGVLAHELAHISLRHNRKHIARDGIYSLMAIMMSGVPDITSSHEAVKSLIFSGYSREFEAEADILARQWMAEAGYEAQAFDEMIIALYNHECGDNCEKRDSQTASGWFDTHPSLSERLSLQAQ